LIEVRVTTLILNKRKLNVDINELKFFLVKVHDFNDKKTYLKDYL